MRTIMPLWHVMSLAVTSAALPLAGQLFQLKGSNDVNNVKLSWPMSGNSSYTIARSKNNESSQIIANIRSDSYDDYNLDVGSEYSYTITKMSGTTLVDQSNKLSLIPFSPSAKYNTYNNSRSSSLSVKSDLVANGLYYSYKYETFPNGSWSSIVEQTSTDGYDFTGNTTVLSGSDLCASANYSCHLERVTFLQHPTTGQVVMWAHLENNKNYDLAQVAVAYGLPGTRWKFGGPYRPLGHDSRDLTFFADQDEAWIISATDTNTNMNIYSLSSNWTSIDKVAAEVNVNLHREAPSVLKAGDWYYLYTSRAEGWYPSQPEYIASEKMSGPWSSPVVVGNTNTFCTQSGSVQELSNGQWIMLADRWSSNWNPQGGPSRELAFPISLAPEGNYSSFAHYPTVEYSDSVTAPGQAMYGVQAGRIVSNFKPSSCSNGTKNIAVANDGVQDDPNSYFVPSAFPFWYQIDLQNRFTIVEVDLTTNMVQGSETYYQFTISGSVDGSTFDSIADRTNNTDVGFVASTVQSTTQYRYIRINVDRIINTQNGHAATWAAGIVEVTVYGK